MEKKTMGGYLAALRRANGMTQRELAERLNVSDKSVSRWERDEGAPDLTLIPVIAEVFGVTCDELLRGERAASSSARCSSSRRLPPKRCSSTPSSLPYTTKREGRSTPPLPPRGSPQRGAGLRHRMDALRLYAAAAASVPFGDDVRHSHQPHKRRRDA